MNIILVCGRSEAEALYFRCCPAKARSAASRDLTARFQFLALGLWVPDFAGTTGK